MQVSSHPKSGSRFQRRFILSADSHSFIGRVYDLSIVAMSFDSYDDLAQYLDSKYVFHVNLEVSILVRRTESLNLVGALLWPKPLPSDPHSLPVSLFEWLTITADVFLMRYISVLDCAIIVTNEVYECCLEHRKCSIENLRKKGVSVEVIALLNELQNDQGKLRDERNTRFHHGRERTFTMDDDTFRSAAMYSLRGAYTDGRCIDVQRTFKEGLVDLQREFNRVGRRLGHQLDRLYGLLGAEFDCRFAPKFKLGYGGLQRQKGANSS